MAASAPLVDPHFSQTHFCGRAFFFIPIALALVTAVFVLSYVSMTSHIFLNYQNLNLNSITLFSAWPKTSLENIENLESPEDEMEPNGEYMNNKNVFHDEEIFQQQYKEMNKSFKIYVYNHTQNYPFSNILDPPEADPTGGNYASENFFKKALLSSHFVTKDPEEADFFYLPFSIAKMRSDPRIDVEGIPDFVRSYVSNISRDYPYWNRTGGADHFYVSCHSIGQIAVRKAPQVKINAIQAVCSSSYHYPYYISHKDFSVPQIWPRFDDPGDLASSERKSLAFFAGAINSPARESLLRFWENDTEIFVHYGRLKTPYADALLGSKFCLQVKGYGVNTARIGDSVYYGCVPVILANHYDLPFADILNWKSFGVVVNTADMSTLKKILKGISFDEYMMLQKNVLKVRRHFQWHSPPVDYDTFHMIMYELWLRRSSISLQLSS